MRKGAAATSAVKEDLFLFWEKYVFLVASRRKCSKVAHTKKFSDYVTASDEGFAYLLLYNGLERWLDMSNKNKEKSE